MLIVYKKGQTLVELLIVMTVVILIVVGLMTVSRQSIRTEDAARAQSEATKLAEEGVELIRGVKNDQTYSYLNSRTSETACYAPDFDSDNNKWFLENCTNSTNDIITLSGSNITFTRKIGIRNPSTGSGNESVCIDSVVFWQDQGGVHQGVSQTIIGNNNLRGNSSSSGGCRTPAFTYP